MLRLTSPVREIAIAAALITFGVVARLLPHVPDATPLTAVTLGSSVYVSRRFAVFVPIITIALSDLLVGFYDWRVMVVVYGSWLLIGLLSLLATKKGDMRAIAGMTVASSFIFFLTTNFAVWAFTPWYAKTLSGLLYCYALGLPFMQNMLVGDILYTSILLGAFASFRIPTNLTRKLAYATQ